MLLWLHCMILSSYYVVLLNSSLAIKVIYNQSCSSEDAILVTPASSGLQVSCLSLTASLTHHICVALVRQCIDAFEVLMQGVSGVTGPAPYKDTEPSMCQLAMHTGEKSCPVKPLLFPWHSCWSPDRSVLRSCMFHNSRMPCWRPPIQHHV